MNDQPPSTTLCIDAVLTVSSELLLEVDRREISLNVCVQSPPVVATWWNIAPNLTPVGSKVTRHPELRIKKQ